MADPTPITYHRGGPSGLWWYDSPAIAGMSGAGDGSLESARRIAREAVVFYCEDDTAQVGVETYDWTDEHTGAVVTTSAPPVGI